MAQVTPHNCPIKNWVGREAELEELLRTAEVVSVEDIGVGVTKPSSAILKKGEHGVQGSL